MSKISSCLLVSTFTIYFLNFLFLYGVIQSQERSSSILRFLFHLFVNCKLSIVSVSLNFTFCTDCPASNSLASCGQCFCNITCLIIKFVVVCCVSCKRSIFKGLDYYRFSRIPIDIQPNESFIVLFSVFYIKVCLS